MPKSRRILIFSFILSILFLELGMKTKLLFAMPPVKREVLANGLVLLVSEDHSLPSLTVKLLVDAGSRRDPVGQEGLSYLTARGILLGTSRHSLAQINEELDFMGASLEVTTGRDTIVLGLRVLKKDLDRSLDLFMETATKPSFPVEEVQREIQQTIAAIQSEEDVPQVVAEKIFQRTLFSNGPYGHPVVGTKESLSRLTREAALRFYQTYYHPNNAILTVVGDTTFAEVKAKLAPLQEGWATAQIREEHFTTEFVKGPEAVKVSRDIAQANVILGNGGISRDNPDFYPLALMNFILGGGGFGSRLFDEIRVKRGLAYSVVSFLDPGKYPGSFQIILQTKNASAKEAISIALREMEKIQGGFVSEEELERAKQYTVGSFPLRLDTQAELAAFINQVEYYKLGLRYAEEFPKLMGAVTREEVLRVAKAYLQPQSYVLVIVGDLKEAGMAEPSQ
jgi:zinc protease